MILWWLWLALSIPTHARDPQPELFVSVDEVLDSVDESLPLLLASSAKVDAASGKRLGAMGWLDPKLTADGGARFGQYDHVYGSVALQQDTPLWGLSVKGGWRVGAGAFPRYETLVTTGDSGELFATAYLPLLQGGQFDRVRAEMVRSDAAYEGAEAAYQADRVRLRFAARRAWATWMAAGARLSLAEELLDLARLTQEATEELANRGAAARIDTLDVRRAVLERTADVEAAHRDLIAAALELGLYWRDADGTPRDLRGKQPVAPPPLPDEPPRHDVATLVSEALAARPEIARLDAQRRGVQASLRAARVNVLPKLNLMGHVERDLPAPNLAEPVTDAKVGAVMELPLALRKGRGELISAKADLLGLDAERTWLIDRVTNEVQTAIARDEAAYVQAANTAEAAVLSAEVAEGTRGAWRAGARDLLQVWLRDQQRFQIETRAIRSWQEWYVAEAALRAALGRP